MEEKNIIRAPLPMLPSHDDIVIPSTVVTEEKKTKTRIISDEFPRHTCLFHDGKVQAKYVFQRLPAHAHSVDRLMCLGPVRHRAHLFRHSR